ncbi:hypothetical protein KR51_00006740 [Rubidibacter lacunae KORDI 51-2]|uniref:Uncharacterized protein n=1 Tax=Rubidibacter lacunae KORDI 51-2 TaxID=582515 RepID=U5DPS3_9CHRO|nr:hypothetical protein [Rubidibacter lacunae]ERN42584.1 hypothetical protein KR51_00006740 [Rubidibacter lacunae KORDI 51-2]
MTGRTIDNGASTVLLLIVPAAIALVVLFVAWPVLLGVALLSLGWRLWQQYQWQQWSARVDPFFKQLMRDNEGRMTAADLALSANLTGDSAQRFLARKATEFNALRRDSDLGTAYYFLTASALGSAFDTDTDATDIVELDADDKMPVETAPASTSAASLRSAFDCEIDDPDTEGGSVAAPTSLGAALRIRQQEQSTAISLPSESSATSTDLDAKTLALIQADLAKRLDVHPSTVTKRKGEPDFSEWSQCRDPEGIAWVFDPQKKVFRPRS